MPTRLLLVRVALALGLIMFVFVALTDGVPRHKVRPAHIWQQALTTELVCRA